MLILPAIDLRGGKCVRLKQGDYAQETVYGEDPGAVARQFAEEGAEWIHVVDLDGAKTGQPENFDSIRAIVQASGAKVEVGGGVRTLETAQRLLDVGVSRVIFGTRLLATEDRGAKLFAELGEQAVAGIDARDGKVATIGWTEQSTVDAVDFARVLEENGAKRFIVTDIATDGMLQGPNLPMLEAFAKAVKSPVIASGGVSNLDDLEAIQGLPVENIEGIIVGKAIYESRFTVREAVSLVR